MDWLQSIQIAGGKDVLIAIVDFVIVYFAVYQILLLIKGTRAVQIMVGLIVVVAFFFLSKNDFLTLPTTHWFINKFIGNFIIILVIIFQTDIRRALAQFGRTTLFSSVRSLEDAPVLEEVIKASVMLSQRKIGALIAIERSAGLDEFTAEGIRVDAVVTKDLLYSIFLPEHQNPLHDGAVIVRGGRIAAAGCFLPLTNNLDVEKSLGTRHRAAIGLSEEADAAIVVVSEETGTISIAFREELIRGLNAHEMRDLLQRIFSTGAEEDEEFIERFRRDELEDGESDE